MKGDFSRDSFHRLHHYSRVLQQQGRVELDADGNERQSIQLHQLRSLAADLIGPHGGPGTGFAIVDKFGGKPLKQDFIISKGHYYVDGWLCENDADVFYAVTEKRTTQPWLPKPEALVAGRRYLAYLDVWERHVTSAEVDSDAERNAPTALREVALGGVDTTTRTQVVWQVKVSLGADVPALPPDPVNAANWAQWMKDHWVQWQGQWQPPLRGLLKAKAVQTTEADAGKPCVVSPQSRYRGLENQLYRIEIHRSGVADDKEPPTFVWSRENGSVLFPVERIDARSVKLADGWRDARFGLAAGDVVELSDEDLALGNEAGPLLRVTGVDIDTLTISFETDDLTNIVKASRHAVLRRWDHGHRKGDIDSRKATEESRPNIANDLGLTIAEGRWLVIEDGIVVWFAPAAGGEKQRYRTGDHWLIPARTAIGDVLWPRGDAELQPPHGGEHHYAPLAIVTVAGTAEVSAVSTPAGRFKSLVELSA